LGWRIDYFDLTLLSVRNLSNIAHTRACIALNQCVFVVIPDICGDDMEQPTHHARVHATGGFSFNVNGFGALRLAYAWLNREASILNPVCFALVMATGIISNAFLLSGYAKVSDALFGRIRHRGGGPR
jgi:hypothetical protein